MSPFQDELPDGVSLLDLGTFQLKDIDRAEGIHQLVITGLPADFPPLKAQQVQLPVDRDLDEIQLPLFSPTFPLNSLGKIDIL